MIGRYERKSKEAAAKLKDKLNRKVLDKTVGGLVEEE